MAGTNRSTAKSLMSTIGSVKTGVILLIAVGVVAAAGTVILQRPMTEPEQMERAYSPQVLRVLDAVGLTDVYHTWWFIALLLAVAVSIVAASIERWPNAWRFYARPYRRPEPHFRAATKNKVEFPIIDPDTAIAAAERALRRQGLKPQRVIENEEVSLYAEKSRFSVFAVYIVHASLLLIFLGGIIDGVWGYKGYIRMTPGQELNTVDLRDKRQHTLPFTLRCDGTGQENHPDGTPKRWWSKMVVLDSGKETLNKTIEVNDPLTYKGVRFFQSSFGRSDEVIAMEMDAIPQTVSADKSEVAQIPGAEHVHFRLDTKKTAQIDADTTIRLLQFIPDFFVQDGQIFRRSNNLVNPALEFAVVSKGQEYKVWLFPNAGQSHNQSPFALDIRDAEFANYTGLQVAYEPGQWAVWAGCILMGLGLFVAFYMVHVRVWAQTVADGKGGLVLWVGAAANKNREMFEQRFKEVTQEIEKELKSSQPQATASAAAGK